MSNRALGQSSYSAFSTLVFLLLLVLAAPHLQASTLDRAVIQYGPYAEWSFSNPGVSGNPFDVEASATFRHVETGEEITTGIFFAGGDEWRLRFTGARTGVWTFRTASAEPNLSGHEGTVTVTHARLPGYVTAQGDKWVRSNGRAFVPQYVMYAGPHYFHDNLTRIRADIQTFIGEHGFTGLHVPVFCRWFDIDQDRCDRVGSTDPDLATFEALETLIAEVYAAGGVVHLWMWGDTERRQNPQSLPGADAGVNQAADLRLQRYIAARLGPLPGWTVGYGFDLFEWVSGRELTSWHGYKHARFGWPHLAGARSNTNRLDQLSEVMDYSSYEQHRPDYAKYLESIARRPGKPTFSEDRFRFRGASQRSKDYTFVEMRRGMWHSAMAGGVANIWGNLTRSDGRTYDDDINEGLKPSNAFPNRHWFKTYSRFFENRFTPGMRVCNELSDGSCLRDTAAQAMIVYRENVAAIEVDLRGLPDDIRVMAVRADAPYQEVDLGTFTPEVHRFLLPATADWALSIGRDGFGRGLEPMPPTLVN